MPSLPLDPKKENQAFLSDDDKLLGPVSWLSPQRFRFQIMGVRHAEEQLSVANKLHFKPKKKMDGLVYKQLAENPCAKFVCRFP